MTALPLPDAVVFDFDGLVFDSETPIFEASRSALRAIGHDITVEGWSTVIGHGEADSFHRMEAAVGSAIDQEAYAAAYAATDRSWRDTIPANPGVEALLDALRGAGVPCAIASSSPSGWIEDHLSRLGLRDRFATIANADRVHGRTKPAPDSYLLACADLGVEPARCVALEDSSPGIAAAVAAGLKVVAVPSHITVHTDLTAAHRTVPSLEHLTLAELAELVADRAA
ncbi:HAD-IA family hydrolase [Aquihabitans sp. G128]|uniref:HAD family hydrolase n=1 Tax=Aquihabitans sp. G128 TaxID=2849779 RepID=UPI001C22D2D2|nr:HAD-IA family hydrolase [Aquihabitans sp. G128]QXC60147.1 HAD-IA family hydrolase [Aquihabitans sp. G128]